MNSTFLDFVASAAAAPGAGPMERRACHSFLRSMRRNGLQELSGPALRIWAVDMLFSGLKPATAARYLGILHSKYKELTTADRTHDDSPFRPVIREITTIPETDTRRVTQNFKKLPAILKISDKSDRFLTAGIFLYLLYDAGASVKDAVELKYKNFNTDCPQLREIVDGVGRTPQAEYAFPLKQGRKRLPQISKELISAVRRLLTDCGMKFGGDFSREDITALWIYAAWECGVGAREIRNMIPSVPAEYSFLNMLDPEELSERQRSEIICRAADFINSRTRRWFVMKLRAGSRPGDIKDRLAATSQPADILFYYPTRKVLKIKNQKRVSEEVPFLPDILFFKTYRDRVGQLLQTVGDLGWCFKVANTPGSPYSFIPDNEMKRFQRYVGQFTPDIEMRLVSAEPVAGVGEQVDITGGGLFDGQSGEVLRVRKENNLTVYSLRLSQSRYIRWETVDVEEIYVTPASR